MGCTMEEISIKDRKIYRFITTDFKTNTYVLTDGHNIVIDPGELTLELEQFLYHNSPSHIILTHGHFDHIGGVKWLKRKFPKVKVCIHKKDAKLLSNPFLNLSAFTGRVVRSFSQDLLLEEGDFLNFKIIHTPGHSRGSIVLIGEGFCFSGDTLFIESIGRTDIPGASFKTLLRSLERLKKEIPETFFVFPGHGIYAPMKSVLDFNMFIQS